MTGRTSPSIRALAIFGTTKRSNNESTTSGSFRKRGIRLSFTCVTSRRRAIRSVSPDLSPKGSSPEGMAMPIETRVSRSRKTPVVSEAVRHQSTPSFSQPTGISSGMDSSDAHPQKRMAQNPVRNRDDILRFVNLKGGIWTKIRVEIGPEWTTKPQ